VSPSLARLLTWLPHSPLYNILSVADIHRTILYGGIYLYPADAKSPKGKLRLLYEGIPMAMIIEQAGGVASTGMFQGKIRGVTELVPDDIHAKCPIIMGSKRDVQQVYDQYAKAGVDVPKL
jgi:fructose-1,6-bisphosphatase I